MRISDWSSDVCSSDLQPRTSRLLMSGVKSCSIRAVRSVLRRSVPSSEGSAICRLRAIGPLGLGRSEEHTSELQSLMRISYAVFCLKKKNHKHKTTHKTSPTYNHLK